MEMCPACDARARYAWDLGLSSRAGYCGTRALVGNEIAVPCHARLLTSLLCSWSCGAISRQNAVDEPPDVDFWIEAPYLALSGFAHVEGCITTLHMGVLRESGVEKCLFHPLLTQPRA